MTEYVLNSELENINLGRMKSMGILSPEFLPFLLPHKYLDLRKEKLIKQFKFLPVGEKCTLYGSLSTHIRVDNNKRPGRVVIRISDQQSHFVSATFFGDPRVALEQLKGLEGTFICMTGIADIFDNKYQLKSPQIIDNSLIGRIVPLYHGKPNVISPETVGKYMGELLPALIPVASQWLREKLNWTIEVECKHLSIMPVIAEDPRVEFLLKTIHSPRAPIEGVHACKLLRLIATADVLKAAREESIQKSAPESAIAISKELLDALMSETARVLVPTDEQRSVIDEICCDIASTIPMARVLSADVGFGKTFVAGAAAAAVVRAGGTVIWLTPNGPLAVQTRDEIYRWWPDVNPGLVVSDSIDIPDSKFLIGTTALLHRLPPNTYPSLMITDEEQRMGTNQKNHLVGPLTNILYATATCIPRTAALIEYGGMTVSRLTKAHVKKNIKTRMVFNENREKLFSSIKRNVLNGHQALIIYTLAETKDASKNDKTSAEGAVKLWERVFPGRVVYMHGKMKDKVKIAALDAMRNDEADILISTTCVEIGINLPRLRHVAVIRPERLGNNTLHQLRGRAGRTGGEGRFDLFFPEPISAKSKKRLEILVQHSDGFEVASENMKMQGFGDLGTGGTAQSGKSNSFIPGHTLLSNEIQWVLERWL